MAFVCCEETTLGDDRISPGAAAHSRLKAIIDKTELNKAYNDWSRFAARRAGSLPHRPQVDPTSHEAATHTVADPPPPPFTTAESPVAAVPMTSASASSAPVTGAP
ncbi:hypothetical protein BGZ94_006135, partial [Podila epigama]